MLPIALVLLVASSAFAAPPVILNQYENSVGDGSLLGAALNVVDGGDTNVYILNLEETIKDLAAYPGSQTCAYGQLIALLSAISAGRPGDSCSAANLINAYASGSDVRSALAAYISSLASDIDLIALRKNNPEAARYSVSSSSGCSGEGRSYLFEGAWQKVINANPNSVVYEQYCVSKRGYGAVDARTNIATADFTAASLPPVCRAFQYARGEISQFVKALASNVDVKQAAYSLRKALLSSV